MLKIGLTGGIGSGKSTVAKLFVVNGIPVYESDKRAKWLIENHPEIKIEILELFGEQAYFNDGNYNRSFVAEKAFGNIDLLNKLNSIVHPRVGEDFENWAKGQKNVPFVIKEAAIMKRGAGLDKIIVVESPEDLRVQRLLARDKHRDLYQIKEIIQKQKSAKEYLELADFVIKNDEKVLLIPQVLEVLRAIS